ncbi:MAG: alkaline phosphatase family protein [Herpetosiphonaceae bacterium]|nr:alkaline phosphatase family protein [Herpetosiphonaceae bacterium]
MIDQASLDAVDAAQLNSHFIHPLYDSYGFAQIPQTLRCLLTDDQRQGVPFGPRSDLYQKYDTVILFFIDAFGWRFFEQFSDHPFLRRMIDEGLVSKLTSQFPSTTAAHVTAIHTGLPVGQSGVYEWYYYEPLVDALIAPLLYSFAGDSQRDTLQGTGVAPSALYPTHTLYQELKAAGVRSVVFQHLAYAFSPYTELVTNGATIMPYRTLPEAVINLTQLLARQDSRSYYFLYYDHIDTICHLYGPDSPQAAAEITAFLDVMEHIFHANLVRHGQRTLFLMTADHGHAPIDPATTVYLNHTLPPIQGWLKTNAAGQPLVPAGSCRDMFLHIKPEYLDDAHAALQHHLAGKAEVQRVDALIAGNFFGATPPSPTFLGRVGNLVILPYTHESVWWYQKDRFEQHHRGAHGGLTPDEMETLLLVQPYG